MTTRRRRRQPDPTPTPPDGRITSGMVAIAKAAGTVPDVHATPTPWWSSYAVGDWVAIYGDRGGPNVVMGYGTILELGTDDDDGAPHHVVHVRTFDAFLDDDHPPTTATGGPVLVARPADRLAHTAPPPTYPPNQAGTCSTCRHYVVDGDRHAIRGRCTRYPTWAEFGRFHYCGEYDADPTRMTFAPDAQDEP